jgi:2'-5' RNA ligase
VTRLRARLAACGFAVETRPFETHVTLFRKVRKAPPLPDAYAVPLVWPVRDFALVVSLAAPEGARYEVLRVWPLA